jgi:CTD small phosphatase-like protein 2
VVLDYLDPTHELIAHRLFRDHCVQTEEGMYIKNLRVLGQRNMNEMLLIDNAAYSFGFQVENGIPCIPFYDNKSDQELKHFITYAKHLATVPDIVAFNQNYFKLHKYTEDVNPENVADKLFK